MRPSNDDQKTAFTEVPNDVISPYWKKALEEPRREKPKPVWYTPPASQPSETKSTYKIHILGEDVRSKFIAHALSGVYDSVELLGWKNTQNRYKNIEKTHGGNSRITSNVEPNKVPLFDSKNQNESPIENLVVTGQGSSAAMALENYKHRINEKTTVCLLNDGLGVLEDVRRRVFTGADSTEVPRFVLGHMSHRLVMDRKFDSVKQLKSGQMLLSPPMLTTMSSMSTKDIQAGIEGQPYVATADFADIFKARELKASSANIDQWLRFKLPPVIFASVVEPVCVALEMSYKCLTQNTAAQRMLYQMLEEIILVLENMQELRDCPSVQTFIQGRSIHRLIHNGILSKQTAPSRLLLQVSRGEPTDVEYFNGYFLRRAEKLGIDMKVNQMMRDMVKAKHLLTRQANNTDIPFEESSIPPEDMHRFRGLPLGTDFDWEYVLHRRNRTKAGVRL